MSRIAWDTPELRNYEVGVDRGVFYPATGPGAAWNGLTNVKESPSDVELKTRYHDGTRTRNSRRPGSFAGTIEAFTYPDSFYDDVLSQRFHKNFGLSYRVKTADSYKIHLVYNILIKPDEVTYEQSDPATFTWDFTTLPVSVPYSSPSSHLVVDASVAYSWTLKAFEDVLYGSYSGEAYLPSPAEVIDIFDVNSIVRIIDNGDGTWTATGPDSVISMLDPTTFQIDWPSAVYIDTDTYKISSL